MALWTAEQVATLIAEYEQSGAKPISEMIGRSEKSVHLKAWAMGIKRVFHAKTPRGKRILKQVQIEKTRSPQA